jgi:hypothetical protein
MIDVTNRLAYQSALHELQQYRRPLASKFRGRFVQLFFAMKFYQDELPSMFSNQFVSTEVLQTLLDDLYSKASKPANQCVLMIFENRYLARTGLRTPGNKTLQNTWRNNFNLQKGVGCYAPPHDLTSQVFLNQDRLQCRYLQPVVTGTLAGASCQLCGTGARYRNEDHRKWLRIDAGGAGYAVVDLMNVGNFLPYVAPAPNRIPILPLIVALYYDALSGLITASRKQLDVAEFASDFNFSTAEVNSYFDQNPASPHNQRLATQFPQLTYHPLVAGTPAAIKRPTLRPPSPAAAAAAPRQPVLGGTPVPPPGVNTGWEAEQYVATALRNAGWKVYDVSRQRLGYDLLAQGERTLATSMSRVPLASALRRSLLESGNKPKPIRALTFSQSWRISIQTGRTPCFGFRILRMSAQHEKRRCFNTRYRAVHGQLLPSPSPISNISKKRDRRV